MKIVYLGLALLMFVGFVGFGIGSSGLSGSIGDLLRDQGSGSVDPVERLQNQATRADAAAKAAPNDASKWSALAQARLRLANVGDNYDANTNQYTPAGKRQLTAAEAAWDKYLALKPAQIDERLARQMAQAFLSLEKPDKAVAAQEALTEVDPSQGTFQNLAILAYQAGQLRKGDLAAAKAVSLAPKDEQKKLKENLEQAKQQSAIQQIQSAAPTPSPTR